MCNLTRRLQGTRGVPGGPPAPAEAAPGGPTPSQKAFGRASKQAIAPRRGRLLPWAELVRHGTAPAGDAQGRACPPPLSRGRSLRRPPVFPIGAVRGAAGYTPARQQLRGVVSEYDRDRLDNRHRPGVARELSRRLAALAVCQRKRRFHVPRHEPFGPFDQVCPMPSCKRDCMHAP